METQSEIFDMIHAHIKTDDEFNEDLKISTEFGEIYSVSGSSYYAVYLHIDGDLLDRDFNGQFEVIIKYAKEFNPQVIKLKINPNYNYTTEFISNLKYFIRRILLESGVNDFSITNLGCLTQSFEIEVDKMTKPLMIHQDGEYSDIIIKGTVKPIYSVNSSVKTWAKVKRILENPFISSANIECIMERKQNFSPINSRVRNLTLSVNRDIGKVISSLNINDATLVDIKEIQKFYSKKHI